MWLLFSCLLFGGLALAPMLAMQGQRAVEIDGYKISMEMLQANEARAALSEFERRKRAALLSPPIK